MILKQGKSKKGKIAAWTIQPIAYHQVNEVAKIK